MASAKKRSFSKSLISIAMVIPAVYSFVSRLVTLVEEDAKLSARSLAFLMIIAFILASLFTSAWLCLMAMLFFYLTPAYFTLYGSLTIIIFCHLVLMMIFSLMVIKMKNKLFFPNVRYFLRFLGGRSS